VSKILLNVDSLGNVGFRQILVPGADFPENAWLELSISLENGSFGVE